MTALTTSTSKATRFGSQDEVTRLVLQLKDLVAPRSFLEAGGTSGTELEEQQQAINQVNWRLAEAVKRRLTADWRLTSRLAHPRRMTDEPSPPQGASDRHGELSPCSD